MLCRRGGLIPIEENDKEYGLACLEVVDRENLQVVEEVSFHDESRVPYLSGFLAFRELPLILAAVKLWKIIPNLCMFDGNAYLHPRHTGIVIHASFFLGKPTTGVSKNDYHIEGAEFVLPDNYEGACTEIVRNVDIYGQVLRNF